MPAILSPLTRLARLASTVSELLRLPVAELRFHAASDPAQIGAVYRDFTRPHPRLPLVGRKTIGAALLDLAAFSLPTTYVDSIGKRNFGGHFARRAVARGYRFTEIDRNRHVDAIDAINRSLPVRQGRAMAPSYRARTEYFVDQPHFRYYGVLDRHGTLMAYCEVGMFGNFALLSRLLGYRNNDGIMHFMIVEIVSMLIAESQVRYVMYDTWYGASEGLRKFKAILGFKPYRARYVLDRSTPSPQRQRPCYSLSR